MRRDTNLSTYHLEGHTSMSLVHTVPPGNSNQNLDLISDNMSPLMSQTPDFSNQLLFPLEV